MIQYFLAELYMMFLGPIRTDLFKYRFGHAVKNKKKQKYHEKKDLS